MPLSKETEAFYRELLRNAGSNVSDDERKAIEKLLSQTDTYVRSTVLARSDYSRQMDDVRKREEQLKTEYAQKMSEADRYRKELADWKTMTETEYKQTVDALRAAEAKIQDIKRKAQSDALTEEDLKWSAPSPTPAQPPAPSPAPAAAAEPKARYVTEEEAARFAQDTTLNSLRMAAALNKLGGMHRKLYGADLEDIDDLVEEAASHNRPLLDVWRDRYNVPAREEELKKQEFDARLAAAVEERVAAMRNQDPFSAPAAPRGDGSPVFTLEAPGDRPQSSEREALLAGVSALESGKYRQPAA